MSEISPHDMKKKLMDMQNELLKQYNQSTEGKAISSIPTTLSQSKEQAPAELTAVLRELCMGQQKIISLLSEISRKLDK